METKWYLQTWFIALLFALWMFLLPLFLGIYLLSLKKKADRKNLEAYQELLDDYERSQALMTPQMQDAFQLECHIASLNEQSNAKQRELLSLDTDLISLQQQIQQKKEDLVVLDDELLFQDFGLYTPTYDFANAFDYKEALIAIRQKQKDLIKQKTAVSGASDWTLNGNKQQGQRMIANMQKLVLRAFNTDCDRIISKVRYTNFDSSLNHIYRSAEMISTLCTLMNIRINDAYLNLKIQELRLAFEFQTKKQQELEDARIARAEQQEQERLQKELEAEQSKLEKEQAHYQNAFEHLCHQLENTPNDPNLLAKHSELEKQLADIDLALTNLDYRQANMRAGYVYIISNIGAFGKDVYKIGMTRRLDPQERIDELGGASVPFRFDVHAMIFSDDAPALENALHKAFADRKVNLVNQRREFFHVTLDEIKAVIRDNYDKTVEFTDFPEAEQYRISEKMRAAQY